MREVDYAQAREENLNNMTAKTDRRLVEKHRQYHDQQSAYKVVVGEVILSTKRRRVSKFPIFRRTILHRVRALLSRRQNVGMTPQVTGNMKRFIQRFDCPGKHCRVSLFIRDPEWVGIWER